MLRKRSFVLLFCFLSSAVLHVTIFLWLSGYNGFAFPLPLQYRTISVTLSNEISQKVGIAAGKTYLPFKKPSGVRDLGEDTDAKIYQNDLNEDNDKLPVIQAAYTETVPAKIEDAGENRGIDENTGIKGNDQDVKPNELDAKGDSPPISKSVNEKLSFDIYWLGILAGKAVLEANSTNGSLRITSQVHSSPFLSAFYKVEDFAESLVVGGMPANLKIKQHEGKYRSDKETIFDMGNGKIIFFNYLKGKKDEHTVSGIVWDVLSGFYYLRSLPLEIGKAVYVDIFDSNKFLKAEISILRKEKIVTPTLGEVDTVIVRPQLGSEGLFNRNGDVLIWLTDDDKRIPVRIETKVPVGNIVAELKDLEISRQIR